MGAEYCALISRRVERLLYQGILSGYVFLGPQMIATQTDTNDLTGSRF